MPSADRARADGLLPAAKSLLFATGAVVVATTWPLLHAPIAPGIFAVSTVVAVALIGLYQWLPIALLTVAGEITRRRSTAAHRSFRASVIVVVATLFVANSAGSVLATLVELRGDAIVGWALVVATALAVIAAATLVVRRRRWLEEQMVPALELAGIGGLAVTALLVSTVDSSTDQTTRYATSISPQAEDRGPPVFVIVFDELSHGALLSDDGSIDADRFPNFARLADRATTFTDANASFFNTHHALPSLAEGLAELGLLRSYIQFREADLALTDHCGQVVDCRGIDSLARRSEVTILKHLVVATAAEFVPPPWSIVGDRASHAIAGGAGVPLSVVDPDGLHLFTEAHVDRFLADLAAEESVEGVQLFHTLSSHYPYVRNSDGSINLDPVSRDGAGVLSTTGFSVSGTTRAEDGIADLGPLYEAYLAQIEYGDAVLGRLLDGLAARDLLEGSVIAVTADHGLRRELYDTPPDVLDPWVTHVPLIVSAPALEAATIVDEYLGQHQLPDLLAAIRHSSGIVDPEALGVTGASQAWFVVDGIWVYHRADGQWRKIAELPSKAHLERADRACFVDPLNCERQTSATP